MGTLLVCARRLECPRSVGWPRPDKALALHVVVNKPEHQLNLKQCVGVREDEMVSDDNGKYF